MDSIDTHNVGSQEIFAECQRLFNQPVLFGGEVARLIGYGETAADIYYIATHLHGKQMWHSAVGGATSLERLRGQGYVRSSSGEDWDDFVRLDSLLELNRAPKLDGMIVDIRPDDDEGLTIRGYERA